MRFYETAPMTVPKDVHAVTIPDGTKAAVSAMLDWLLYYGVDNTTSIAPPAGRPTGGSSAPP
jgi:hypothetical protein